MEIFFEVNFGQNFDAVISTSALYHFQPEEKKVLYQKIFDCLKENGLFINCDKIARTQEKKLYELEHNIDIPLTVKNEIEILKK